MAHDGGAAAALELTPLLKTTAQIDGMRAFLRVHDPGNDLVTAPLAGELSMMLARSRDGRDPEPLTLKGARAYPYDVPTLARMAIRNLHERFTRVEREPVVDMEGVFVTRAPLAASTLVLAPLYEQAAERCRGELLVVAPARDFVLSADSYRNGVLYDLPILASRIQERALDPISDSILRWTPTGFEPF